MVAVAESKKTDRKPDNQATGLVFTTPKYEAMMATTMKSSAALGGVMETDAAEISVETDFRQNEDVYDEISAEGLRTQLEQAIKDARARYLLRKSVVNR
jgi:hypothetical protein